MAHAKNPVVNEMRGGFSGRDVGTNVGGHPTHTTVDLGKHKAPPPMQTAGLETRSPRRGTKQRHFGKTDT
jgi:hypothetical protein